MWFSSMTVWAFLVTLKESLCPAGEQNRGHSRDHPLPDTHSPEPSCFHKWCKTHTHTQGCDSAPLDVTCSSKLLLNTLSHSVTIASTIKLQTLETSHMILLLKGIFYAVVGHGPSGSRSLWVRLLWPAALLYAFVFVFVLFGEKAV